MSAINPIQHLNVNISTLDRISNSTESTLELKKHMKALLEEQIHGISFSPYEEYQDPSNQSQISEEQIRKRLNIIKPYTKWVRTFSCTDGNELAPRVAHELGLKTMVGAWISDDYEMNEKEITNIIEVAKAGHADIVAIGNEVVLREELTIEELVGYINRVKAEIPDVEVGYVDAYYVFDDYPELVEACDVILANCYPFWEYCNLEQSINYMKLMYQKALQAGRGKKVIISETGWPTKGDVLGGAEPSYDNAMRYFINTYEWAHETGIEVFYFSSFDEEWKTHHEGECGSSWGLWDKHGQYKYSI